MSAIDPGVEDGIKDGADNAESDYSESDREKQEEADLMQPSRWWFASVACPLLAGTFGPMASGFNICALVHPWRQTIPNVPGSLEGEGHVIPDPKWELVSLRVLKGVEVIANKSMPMSGPQCNIPHFSTHRQCRASHEHGSPSQVLHSADNYHKRLPACWGPLDC